MLKYIFILLIGFGARGGKDEFTPIKGGSIMDLDEEQADKVFS